MMHYVEMYISKVTMPTWEMLLRHFMYVCCAGVCCCILLSLIYFCILLYAYAVTTYGRSSHFIGIILKCTSLT